MSTLIDALKGLHKRMDYYATPTIIGFASALAEIIAEHERSGTDERTRIEHERGAEPVKLFYQPSDLQIREMLVAVSDEAKDHDIESGLPIWTDGAAFSDRCGLVDLVRHHMDKWREAAE